MINKRYRIILTVSLVFLLMNVTIVSCTSDLLRTSKTSSVIEKGNEEVLGKVTCIDENTLTLAIGNESNSEILKEENIDVEEEEKDNENAELNNILFELSGEEKAIEILDDSLIKVEKGNKIAKGKLSDIRLGNVLSIQYDESNNIILVLIKDSSKYANEIE